MFCLMASDCVAMSRPPTVALPEVGFSRPQSIRIVVDFPAPLGPRKPKISPRWTSRFTWSTATNVPKVFTRSWVSTAFCSGGMFGFPDETDEDVFERGYDDAERGWLVQKLLQCVGELAGREKEVKLRTVRLHG